MARRHHINNWVYGIQPDTYESEWVPKNTGLVMHELHCSLGGTFNQTSAGVTPGNYQVWLTDRSAGNNTDGFWPSWTVGINVINAFDKFETIETDEIAWFKRNLSYHTGQNGNGWYPVYLTSPTLKEFKYFDEVNNPNNITPNIHNFLQAYGGCYPWGDVNSRAVYFPTSVTDSSYNGNIGFKVYDISYGKPQPTYTDYNVNNWGSLTNVTGGSVIYGNNTAGVWKVPETNEILQLLGQLPRYHEIDGTGTRFDDIKDFFLSDADSDPVKSIPAPIGSNWYHKNISGLSFLPNGKQQSGFGGQSAMNPDHFGVGSFIATFRRNGSIAMSVINLAQSRNATDIQGGNVVPYNFIGVAVGSNWSVSGHNGGIRYCRIKTVAERGYKLVIDTLEDKVLVVDPSDLRTDMPIGMERGIALRYMNREHRIILRKYSEIQNEAVELMNGITLEV